MRPGDDGRMGAIRGLYDRWCHVAAFRGFARTLAFLGRDRMDRATRLIERVMGDRFGESTGDRGIYVRTPICHALGFRPAYRGVAGLVPRSFPRARGLDERRAAWLLDVVMGTVNGYPLHTGPVMDWDGGDASGDAPMPEWMRSHGFDWTATALEAFVDRAAANGLHDSMGGYYLNLHGMMFPPGEFALALDHMSDSPEWMNAATGTDADSGRFGMALADAWADAYATVPDFPSIIGVFPSLRLYRRWRRAVDSAPRVPETATTVEGMRWILGRAYDYADHPVYDGGLYDLGNINIRMEHEWMRMLRIPRHAHGRGRFDHHDAARTLDAVMTALESDGARDYGYVIDGIRHMDCADTTGGAGIPSRREHADPFDIIMMRHGSDDGHHLMRAVRWPSDWMAALLDGTDSPARILAALDACHVVLEALGAETGVTDHVWPGRWTDWPMRVRIPRSVVIDAAEMLDKGAPADMVAESPALHIPDADMI